MGPERRRVRLLEHGPWSDVRRGRGGRDRRVRVLARLRAAAGARDLAAVGRVRDALDGAQLRHRLVAAGSLVAAGDAVPADPVRDHLGQRAPAVCGGHRHRLPVVGGVGAAAPDQGDAGRRARLVPRPTGVAAARRGSRRDRRRRGRLVRARHGCVADLGVDRHRQLEHARDRRLVPARIAARSGCRSRSSWPGSRG